MTYQLLHFRQFLWQHVLLRRLDRTAEFLTVTKMMRLIVASPQNLNNLTNCFVAEIRLWPIDASWIHSRVERDLSCCSWYSMDHASTWSAQFQTEHKTIHFFHCLWLNTIKEMFIQLLAAFLCLRLSLFNFGTYFHELKRISNWINFSQFSNSWIHIFLSNFGRWLLPGQRKHGHKNFLIFNFQMNYFVQTAISYLTLSHW